MPDLRLGGRLSLQDPTLAALTAALNHEWAWTRAEHARQRALSLEDRVAVGLSWPAVELESATWGGGGRLIWRLRAPKGTALHDGLRVGDPVTIGPIGAPDDGVEGMVTDVDGRVAEVRVPDGPDPSGPIVVSKRLDPRTVDGWRAGLARLDKLESPLREALLGRAAPALPDPLPDHPAFAGLDPTQAHAARVALARPPLAVIHGPPGTGKTTVIVALLRALVAEGERVAALADSNAAVDHLARRAAAKGLRVLRLGHPERAGADLRALTLEGRVANGPLAPALAALDRDMARLRGQDGKDAYQARRRLAAERDALWAQAEAAELADAQVVAATLATFQRRVLALPKLPVAIVDEATQAIAPALLATAPWVDRMVLVGDPYQLGPVVLEPGNPLGESWLEVLLRRGAQPAWAMLGVQRRMHVDIQALVSDVYGPDLTAAPEVAGHTLADLGVRLPEGLTEVVTWVDTSGAGLDEARDPVTRSLFNAGEVALVALAVERLREAGVQASQIAVIAPYAAQVARLRAARALAGVEVDTVNAFQGREQEAVIVSFVRSNPDGELGFVADGRRLTVALSRARRWLVLVGDASTLAGHPRFAALLAEVELRGGLISAWSPPWSEVLG